jgi:hypothetical protein
MTVITVLNIELGNYFQSSFIAYRPINVPSGNYIIAFELDLADTSGFPGIYYQNGNGATNVILTSPAINIADGKTHLLIGTISQDATNTTLTLYLDGVQVSTKTNSTAAKGGFLQAQANNLFVGGWDDGAAQFTNIVKGTISHVGMWNRVLSGGELADLYQAFLGYPNETSGTRISRYLSGNYLGPAIVDSGQSVMGPDNLAEGTLLLDACQNVTLSENGNFWVDGNGNLTFAARTRRYLATSSTATFGENAGENPYENDVAFDFDATLVYNDIEVQQTGGIKATAANTASQNAYGPRSYQREINVASSLETQDAANWILYTHKDPAQRIANLVIKPSSNPALWPMALGAEIGQRVTVKRRTTAGLTMSTDYFIEQVSHNRKPDEWTVSFQMSPTAPSQVWILGDATYSVLDSTTLLAY